jgi:hypothetical protein
VGEKKLTKIKALEICEELWTWLAKTGTIYKKEWPGWEKYGKMKCSCPCCEYTSQTCWGCNYLFKFTCARCPIKWVSKKDYYDYSYGYCEQNTSPFNRWKNAKTIIERKAAAKDILVLIRKTLKHERSK